MKYEYARWRKKKHVEAPEIYATIENRQNINKPQKNPSNSNNKTKQQLTTLFRHKFYFYCEKVAAFLTFCQSQKARGVCIESLKNQANSGENK